MCSNLSDYLFKTNISVNHTADMGLLSKTLKEHIPLNI